MSQNFKVESTTGREEWTGRYGPMITYRLMVDGGQEVDLNQKPDTPAPQIGDEIWGHLVDGRDRPKIVKDQKDGQPSGGGGGGRKDELGPIIHRQVALKIIAPKICETGRLTDGLKNLATEIEAFIAEAGSSQPAKVDSPASANGQSTPGTFDSEGFSHLLEQRGLDASEAGTVVAYVIQELSPAEQDQATVKLQDPVAAQFTADWLKSKTEAALGSPIPTGGGSGSDDIPF